MRIAPGGEARHGARPAVRDTISNFEDNDRLMLMRILTGVIVLCAVSVAVPARVSAGVATVGQDQNARKIKENVLKRGTGPRATVTVKLHNQASHKGHVREANDNDFVVVDRTGGTHTIRYADVRSLGGGGGLSGAGKLAIGIAIGVGAVLAVLVAIARSDD